MNARKLAIIVILILHFAGIAHAKLTPSQIVKKYSPSVVTIIGLDQNGQPLSLGSGFFINTKGDIASNHHVLEGTANAIIKTTDGRKGQILEIINDDSELDLLIARTSLSNISPLPLGDSDRITVGEEIVAIGNPAGLQGTVSNGLVSGIRALEGLKLIQITAPISPGSSGGPVFNATGQVIGVATAYLDAGQNLNFAMPANYLKSLKSTKIRLNSLPRTAPGTGTLTKDKDLIKIFDIHYVPGTNFSGGDLFPLQAVDFAISNHTHNPIKNIKLFFIYRNPEGQIINYSAGDFQNTILPGLALQFTHYHTVKYFYKDLLGKTGTVEIRVLDYQIQGTGRTSPKNPQPRTGTTSPVDRLPSTDRPVM